MKRLGIIDIWREAADLDHNHILLEEIRGGGPVCRQMQGCCLASPICVVSPFLGGSSPKWEKSPLFFDPVCQQLTIKTASKAERESILRADRSSCGPFCVRSRSACGTVLRAEQNGTRKAGEYI